MLLNATDDEGNKLSYRDIREEVDTFMFEVTKELIDFFFIFCCFRWLCFLGFFGGFGFVCWDFFGVFFLQRKIQNLQVLTLVLVEEVAFSLPMWAGSTHESK